MSDNSSLTREPEQKYDHGLDVSQLQRAIRDKLLYEYAQREASAGRLDWSQSLALVVRDHLVERWMQTTEAQYAHTAKRVYYLSMEFLIGRATSNGLHALGIYDLAAEALQDMGLDLDEIRAVEPDAA
ncbi:MAG: glycogen phosphorylase, partial [Burkholderiaceae bacterium]